MSCDQQSYPYPQAFTCMDGREGRQPPSVVPCWSSFPPAQERARSREKNRGCMGVSPGLALIVLMLFLLVFAALGFEAYQIQNMQEALGEMTKVKPVALFNTPEKQTAHELQVNQEGKDNRPAAHVIGRIETVDFPKTLRWEAHAGRAFVSGAVAYRFEDGALQVNETGLYHIYSRVELLFSDCSPPSSFTHVVFARRGGRTSPVTLMQAHREGFCSHQRGRAWTTESYLASALQLQKFDRVLVNVSHPFYLSHAHYANFFGLYKI